MCIIFIIHSTANVIHPTLIIPTLSSGGILCTWEVSKIYVCRKIILCVFFMYINITYCHPLTSHELFFFRYFDTFEITFTFYLLNRKKKLLSEHIFSWKICLLSYQTYSKGNKKKEKIVIVHVFDVILNKWNYPTKRRLYFKLLHCLFKISTMYYCCCAIYFHFNIMKKIMQIVWVCAF